MPVAVVEVETLALQDEGADAVLEGISEAWVRGKGDFGWVVPAL